VVRKRIPRPEGASFTFVCVGCALVLDDLVDYSWCPRCNKPVDWIEPGVSPWVCRKCDVLVADSPAVSSCSCGRQLMRLDPPSTEVGSRHTVSLIATVRRLGAAVLATAITLALVDPRNERWVRPLLFVAQIASALRIAWNALLVAAVRDLLRDRKTRILHGLEHATIKVLEERGLTVRCGVTYTGFFVLDVDHDGRWWDRLDEVRDAAVDAVRRIIAGERGLAYDPRCGTSRLVATQLVAIAICGVGVSALVLGLRVPIVVTSTIAMLVAARLLAKPLGLWAQRVWTVSTALEAGRVTEVTRRPLADASALQLFVAIDVIPRKPNGPAAALSPLGG